MKFIFVTSKFSIVVDDQLNGHNESQELEHTFVDAVASSNTNCERCWHYRADVGHDPAHPTICARCTSNLFGPGETRKFA